MNGCQYAQKKFSAPASWNTSQLNWDLAFLTKRQFIAKWGETLYATTKNPTGSIRQNSGDAH